MYPVWYEVAERREWYVWGSGYVIMVLGAILTRIDVAVIGFLIAFSIAPLQHFRFKRMKQLREDPLRCECGGCFVTPWELGFDAPADHLVCDNEHGDGRGIPCEKWMVVPPDYQSSPTSTREENEL